MDGRVLSDTDDTTIRLALKEFRAQLPRYLAIYSDELRRRQFLGEQRVGAFAPDTDTIVDFVGPDPARESWPSIASDSARHLGGSMIEALLSTPALRIAILPGVIVELFDLCAHLASSSPPTQSKAEFLAWLRLEHVPGSEQGGLENLRLKLRAYHGKLLNARSRSERRLKFLGASNVADIGDCGLPPMFSYGSDEEAGSISRELSALTRRRYRGSYERRNYCDSVNITAVLQARAHKVHVPLVTRTQRVLEVFEKFVRPGHPESAGLVIAPSIALVVMSLRNADTADIRRLEEKAAAVLEVLTRHPSLLEPGTDAVREFRTYLEATLGLSELSALLHRTWTPPIQNLPDDWNINKLAVLALDLSKSLKRDVVIATRRLDSLARHLIEATTQRSTPQSGNVWQELQPSLEALREVGTQASRVVIQKLIIIEKGATMSEYNITQTGTNLNAVVDSFKTTLLSSSNSPDVQKNLESFVASIVSSELETGKKQEVVEGARIVVEAVKEQGRLSGTGALLWQGVRQAITVIPTAVEAWEALKKLWAP
jgi:hypothetical protein